MALNFFTGVAYDSPDIGRLARDIATRFNQLLQGKLNVAVEFTPAVATTSTVVTDTRLTPRSILLIEPTSSAGAIEKAAGTMFVAAADRGAGTCTITHSVGAAGELFRLVILA